MKKSKRYVRICAALLCAVLCLSVNVAPAMAAKVTQADIDALKGNAASLDKKQKEIQSKLNSLKNDKAAAVQKKTLLDDQIANTNAKISNTEAQISDYNALISQAEIELADAQQREEAQYELFCKRVREMEERGTISYWSVLFKANSFSDLLGSLDFINEVMDYDRRVIQDLQTLQAEIAEKKAGLEANKAALEAAKAELETQKKQLSAQRDEANKLVKEIDDNAAEYQATLKELEAEERRIEQQAYTDFLTGLYNRMCCERDLARQIDQAKKTGGEGALLYLDLDDFKHINDGLGHQYGDVLLKSISHALKRINGIENTCYRMGGDEFVIVIPPDSYSRFENIVEDIKKIFSKPWFLKDADYYCTMSMGIVTFPDAGDSVADLIKKADIAMYEAKKTGKNRVATYREGIDSVSGRRLDMEKNMRDATVEGYREFEVYYQPIIDIQGGRDVCAGAEALIRWNSAKLGFISPAEFIPLAEYLGLINPIGNYVLTEACTRCKRWNESGYPNYKVNVNLSVVQLLQPDIVETVEKALADTGLSPKNLTLEVTESLAINDMERMKEILNRIKSLGVSLALDDFGTGYSSLNHIREIPIDVIKVDQSFVKDLAEDAYSQSFIKMVAELAETIGVSVCVEGIETPEQFRVLQGMKVKYIQGYYFDRPMERHAFEAKYVK